MKFLEMAAPYLKEVEKEIEKSFEGERNDVYRPVLPFIKRGGKRIRPALVFLSTLAADGDAKKAVEPAAVVELFHNFTLIHDDIEDDSKMRRGMPTLHITHGVPIALNSGDALYTLLWKKITEMKMEKEKLVVLQQMYAKAFKKVVEGQGIELAWYQGKKFDIDEKDYYEMIGGKTAALMALSCELGPFLAEKPEYQENLSKFGEAVGIAFQIADDVLNVSGEFEKYQKEIGGDVTEGKRTLMVIHSLKNAPENEKKRLLEIISSNTDSQQEIAEAIDIMKRNGSIDYAREQAERFTKEAKDSIKDLPESDAKKALLEVADYILKREK